MSNPIIDLQKTPAEKDISISLFRNSGFSIQCKGNSTVSWICKNK